MDAFLESIIEQLREFFDPAALGAAVAELIGDTLVAVVVFAAFYLFWRLLEPLLDRTLDRTALDETAQTFATTVIKYTIIVVGAINALGAIGVNTTSVLTSLGIVGLTVGFAARDAFSNLISGILIFLDRPFVIGDLVEIEDKYGTVDSITLRSTRIVTVDGKMLAVPNADIINKTVASYTNFPHLRLDVPVTVAVTENLGRARRLLLSIVESDTAYLDDPPPRVVVTALNDYNVELQLQVWIRDERDHFPLRFALREAVFETFTAAGVDMPYETIAVVEEKTPG